MKKGSFVWVFLCFLCSIQAFSMGEAKCSDASGKLRRTLVSNANGSEIRWIFEDEATWVSAVKVDWESKVQVRGNHEKGAYVVDVTVTFKKGTEAEKIFTVPVLCRYFQVD